MAVETVHNPQGSVRVVYKIGWGNGLWGERWEIDLKNPVSDEQKERLNIGRCLEFVIMDTVGGEANWRNVING